MSAAHCNVPLVKAAEILVDEYHFTPRGAIAMLRDTRECTVERNGVRVTVIKDGEKFRLVSRF